MVTSSDLLDGSNPGTASAPSFTREGRLEALSVRSTSRDGVSDIGALVTMSTVDGVYDFILDCLLGCIGRDGLEKLRALVLAGDKSATGVGLEKLRGVCSIFFPGACLFLRSKGLGEPQLDPLNRGIGGRSFLCLKGCP